MATLQHTDTDTLITNSFPIITSNDQAESPSSATNESKLSRTYTQLEIHMTHRKTLTTFFKGHGQLQKIPLPDKKTQY